MPRIVSFVLLLQCWLGVYCEQCVLQDELEYGVPDVTFLQTSSNVAESTASISDIQLQNLQYVFEDEPDARSAHKISSLAENAVDLYSDRHSAQKSVENLKELLLGAAQETQQIQRQKSSSTSSQRSKRLTNSSSANETAAAEVSGASENTSTDFTGLYLPCLYYGLGCMVVAALWICILRTRLPYVYGNRTMTIKTDKYQHIPGEKSIDLGPGAFAWLWAGMNISTTDITRFSGLDHGMLIAYVELCLKMVLAAGIPLSCVLVPIYWSSGKSEGFLSKMEVMNVETSPTSTKNWAIWGAAGGTWYVVLVCEFLIFRAMRDFIPKRFRWIKEMSPPRATSVLVETIPEGRNTEEELIKYFNVEVFGRNVVKKVYITKDTTSMESIMKKHYDTDLKYQMAKSQGSEAEANELREQVLEVEAEIIRMRAGIVGDRSLNCGTAFVTFYERRDQVVALKLFSPDDSEEIVCVPPPDPTDIIWSDLQVHADTQWVYDWVGLILMACALGLVLNSVLWMTEILSADFLSDHIGFAKTYFEKYPDFAATWEGLSSEVALTIILSLVPTVLCLIFYGCWQLVSASNIQVYLQRWYLYFLIVQTVLAGVFGTSFSGVALSFILDPASLLDNFASNIPIYSHFWTSFLLIEFGTHCLQITRYSAMFKYGLYKLFYNEETAHGLTEPEAQDYNGVGARYARFTYQFALFAVYSVISPLAALVAGFMNFMASRIIYGYLFVYAEVRKPDMGGVMFVTALDHLQQLLLLFILIMTAVARAEAETHAPAFFTASSTIPLLYYYYKFKFDLRWELLEFWELLDPTGMGKQPASKEFYIQPELEEFEYEKNVFSKASQRVKEAIDEFSTRLERSTGC
mmetsp:Transcript_96404/g.171372  ORF Transcript_96404/g.171372 Transcript_96404/m.171372 type:complete len:861 (+) Transcript_96404:76-2658(+)